MHFFYWSVPLDLQSGISWRWKCLSRIGGSSCFPLTFRGGVASVQGSDMQCHSSGSCKRALPSMVWVTCMVMNSRCSHRLTQESPERLWWQNLQRLGPGARCGTLLTSVIIAKTYLSTSVGFQMTLGNCCRSGQAQLTVRRYISGKGTLICLCEGLMITFPSRWMKHVSSRRQADWHQSLQHIPKQLL